MSNLDTLGGGKVFIMSQKHLWICLLAALIFCVPNLRAADIDQLQKDFQSPPDDARIMVRWWWYGPAVTKEGLDREMTAMKAGGIGGFETIPTYPLLLDGGTGSNAVKNLKWMSPEYLDMLGYVAGRAKEMGMRMDVTLGSGWPYGGPMFSPADGAKALSVQAVQVAPGEHTAKTTSATAFAAFAGPTGVSVGGVSVGGFGRGRGGGISNVDLTAFKPVPFANGVAQLPSDFNGGQVIFFDYRQNIMAVKRPANGADGPVIDHLSANAVDKFIQLVAEPEMKACGPNPPYAIFCDSLEISGENWTEDFLAEFQKRRGYDLTPYLPALIGNYGDRTEDIRHDFGQTLTDLFNDNFNTKFRELAEKYHTRFRIQGYGSPAADLTSYGFASLAEGEAGGNGAWRNFRSTRYASSADHLMGNTIASSETFTWLHRAAFRAVPLDIKGEVDTHFLDGINQVICHGWPYTPNGMAYPGASFYAAAVFNDYNPWYIAMPEISRYMQRVSEMMREGTPANDVALYANDSDIWAGAGMGFSSMDAAWRNQTGALDSILDSGYDLDLWDDGMLAMHGTAQDGKLVFGDLKYPIVVINGPRNMPLATARQLEKFADGGGILVSVGTPTVPVRVPGLNATDADQKELQDIMAHLFTAPGAPGLVVTSAAQFAQIVGKKLAPDARLDPASTTIGVIHRHADGGEIYFVANTGDQTQNEKITFRQAGMNVESWDPLTAQVHPLAADSSTDGTTTVSLRLEPLASTIIVFTKRQLPPTFAAPAPAAIDLSSDWNVTFASGPGGSGDPVTMPKLVSWTDLPDMANYSGVATYEKRFTATADMTKGPMWITFGELAPDATAAAFAGRAGGGYVAPVTSPVKDAAVIYINGQRAGAAWCAPLQVDITGLLKEGENTIRIDVGNTCVNYLAKAGFPNYDLSALRQTYGNRFDPQNVNLVSQPLPSGLMGPVTLTAMTAPDLQGTAPNP